MNEINNNHSQIIKNATKLQQFLYEIDVKKLQFSLLKTKKNENDVSSRVSTDLNSNDSFSVIFSFF